MENSKVQKSTGGRIRVVSARGSGARPEALGSHPRQAGKLGIATDS
jgi:hypothetical protein